MVHIIYSFIIFILIIIFLTIIFIQNNKIMNLNKKINNLTDLYDNIRLFKHDFNNIVFTIGGYIFNEDISNLKKYYSSLLKDCKKINNLSTISPEVINDPGIYNLISTKYKKALENDIDMSIEIFLDFTKLKLSTYQFAKILGILLDNAIEATSSTENKKINLNIKDYSNKNTQVLSIENTFSNQKIDISKIYEKGFSGKSEHTGLGLWEVKQIETKNPNIKLSTCVDENYFKQTLEIYY